MKIKLSVFFSILVALLVVVQLIPMNFANAITPSDLTGTPYLIVHDTAFIPSGQASSLTITEADGVTVISPDTSGNYHDIPAGAKIKLVYAFGLSDGAEGALYDYDGNEFFNVTLPGGLNFAPVAGKIVANDLTDGNYDLAILNITGNTLQVNLTNATEDTSSKGGAANDAHLAKWGKVEIDGTFKNLSVGDGTTETITFGTQTIVINRQPLPMDSTMTKSGSYDASTNQITWTVVVTPPAGDPSLAFNGYSVIDEFSANQQYAAGSFIIGGYAIADTLIDLTNLASGKISYLFPDSPPAITGIQTINYKTTPASFSAENGISANLSTYSNKVSLMRGTDKAAEPVTSLLKLDWINKTGAIVDASGVDPTIARWYVDVTIPGVTGKAVTAASIVDNLSSDLELFVNATHPVSIKYGAAVATVVTSGTGAGEYDYSGDVLTYKFPTSNQPTAGTTARLIFYTKVKTTSWNNYLNSNIAISFNNNANLIWNENTTGTVPSDKNTISNGIGSGGLLSKSGGDETIYAYSVPDPGTIHWTITVNRNKIVINNGFIIDEILADQKLLIDASHPLTVNKVGAGVALETVIAPASIGNFIYTDANNFTYKLPTTIDSSYTIDYYTMIKDPEGLKELYKNSETVNYRNNVTLTRGGDISVATSGIKAYSNQMLSKIVATAYNYDPTERTVEWKIIVNRNLLPLTNAILTDILPPGMTLLIDGTHPFSVTHLGVGGLGVLTGATGDSTFTYNLPSSTADQYTITYWSKMSESALQTQWNGSKNFINSIELGSAEIVTPIIVKSTTTIKNPVLDKSYKYTAGHDTIDWSVVINPAQALLKNGVITDVLNSSLQLEPASLKLYKVTINSSTGAANPGGTIVDPADYVVTLPTIANGNKMIIALPVLTSDAYRLEFQTVILTDDINLSNTISLSGTAGDPTGTSDSSQIIVNNLYSGGGSGTNTLTVHKTDSNGDPLSGSKFRLLTVNKDPITRSGNEVIEVTDASGNATFIDLPSWIFYVEEIEPASGYLIPANPISGGNRLVGTEIISVTNALALTDVTFNKRGASGALLSGGSFTLSGKDYALNDISVVASAVNGVVTFKNIPPNQAGVPYTIVETTPPVGHIINTTALAAVVDYNSTKNSLVATVTPNNLVNTPETGSISFTKTGTGGVLLSGGSFTLSGTDYAGNAINISSIAAIGGTLTFPNVPIGSYSIKEVTPPTGYLMPLDATILTVTVAYNAGNDGTVSTIHGTGLGTPIVTSYQDIQGFGVISFTKIDSTDNSLLSGGTFTLTGKDLAGNDVLISSSSVGGTVTFNNVPLGDDYTIKEKVSPPGYLLTATELKASVKYNAAKTSVVTSINADKLSNDRAPLTYYGKLLITKTDTNGNKLEGVEFTLYDLSGNKLYSLLTKGDGTVQFINMPYGSYTVAETKAPPGYIMDNKRVPVEIKSSEFVTLTFINRIAPTVRYGEVRIAKTDEDRKPLAGAEFTLYDQYGNVLKKMVTGNNGLVKFDGLVKGKYILKETVAPTGYILLDEPVGIQITDTQLDYSFTLINSKDDTAVAGWMDEEELPKTGGIPISFYLLFFGIFLVVSGVVLRKFTRYTRYIPEG